MLLLVSMHEGAGKREKTQYALFHCVMQLKNEKKKTRAS